MRNSYRKSRRLLACLMSFAFILAAVGATRAASFGEGASIEPRQEVERITIEELKALLDRNAPVVILDVRGGAVDTKIKGALRLPLDELERRLSELPREREIVTYCS